MLQNPVRSKISKLCSIPSTVGFLQTGIARRHFLQVHFFLDSSETEVKLGIGTCATFLVHSVFKVSFCISVLQSLSIFYCNKHTEKWVS